MTKRYVSGIRPSGKIHLGNYLGALQHIYNYQQTGEDVVFFVADMHGQHTSSEVLQTVQSLYDIGINKILIQSNYKNELLALTHDLSFHVNTGMLNRMTQFKDKTAKGESSSLALFSYPVLMAADILFHKATHVPVGDDQKQHIEFVRDLVDKIGGYTKPEAVIIPVGSRIMSLKDGTSKMSKSDPDDNSRINLSDDADTIRRKIKSAKSGMTMQDNTPELLNLKGIYNALGGVNEFDKTSEFKNELSDLIIAKLKK